MLQESSDELENIIDFKSLWKTLENMVMRLSR